ncbi:MAG TPA: hypothetical protein VFO39_01650 [Candidatus Sulfotelmatobacter sp.]|nr:hypothetical protein [Candidatus Sulfotelmatobacter sp.]
MRRLSSVTVFVLAFALVVFNQKPAAAQHSGGHAGGGGGHAGFGGGGHFSGGGGHFSGGAGFGGHSFGGMRSGPSMSGRGFRGGSSFRGQGFRGNGLRASNGFRSSSGFRSFNRPGFRGPFLHDGFRDRFRDRDRFFFRDRFGFRNSFAFGFPWWWGWGGYYDPYWSWNYDDYAFDQEQANELAQANEMNQESLAEQRMRHEEDQDVYARPDSRQQSPSPQIDHSSTAADPTVLVFRDQHQLEVQNYAIVGQTVWAFTPQRTQKIPLSNLDIPATTKANEDRGVDFRVPGSGEGQ